MPRPTASLWIGFAIVIWTLLPRTGAVMVLVCAVALWRLRTKHVAAQL